MVFQEYFPVSVICFDGNMLVVREENMINDAVI